MIRRMRITNFRSFADAELTLEPLTVLIGPVGAGKSNVLKAVEFLRDAVSSQPIELFGPPPFDFWSVRNRAVSTSTEAIAVEVTMGDLRPFPGEEAEYRIEIAPTKDGPAIAREVLYRASGPGRPARCLFERRLEGGVFADLGAVGSADPSLLQQALFVPGESDLAEFCALLHDTLVDQRLFHLEASALRDLGHYLRAADQGNPMAAIGGRGQGLVEALSTLRHNPDTAEAYDGIVMQLRDVLPTLERLMLVDTGPIAGVGFRHRGHDGYLSAFDASDGTLFTLGLLTILRQPRRPRLLMIEEPETGIHPRRLTWLVDQLQDAAYPPDGSPGTQILISTHSPYLLDEFREMPEAVRIVEYVDGSTRVTPLTDALKRLGVDPADVDEGFIDGPLGRRWYAGLLEEA